MCSAATVSAMTGKSLVDEIEAIENVVDGPLVGRLARGKPSPVHTVVEALIASIVDLIDLGAQFSRIEIDVPLGPIIKHSACG